MQDKEKALGNQYAPTHFCCTYTKRGSCILESKEFMAQYEQMPNPMHAYREIPLSFVLYLEAGFTCH